MLHSNGMNMNMSEEWDDSMSADRSIFAYYKTLVRISLFATTHGVLRSLVGKHSFWVPVISSCGETREKSLTQSLTTISTSVVNLYDK